MSTATEVIPDFALKSQRRHLGAMGLYDHLAELATFRDDAVVKGGDMVAIGNKISVPNLGIEDLEPHDFFLSDLAADPVGFGVKYAKRLLHSKDETISSLWSVDFNGLLSSDSLKERLFTLRAYNLKGLELPEWMEDRNASGVARCLKSATFEFFDNLEAAGAVIKAAESMGIAPEDIRADVSDRRMIIKVIDRNTEAVAKEFLRGYRNPMVGDHERDDHVVFAGLVISNSDVGASSLNIKREIVARVCTNGYRVTWGDKADRQWTKYHRGQAKAAGRVVWSPETKAAQVETLGHEMGDAFKKFLSPEQLQHDIAYIENMGNEPIDPDGLVENLGRLPNNISLGSQEIGLIFADFVNGGRHDRMGVAHAVTSASQRVASPERASDMESNVWKITEAVEA